MMRLQLPETPSSPGKTPKSPSGKKPPKLSFGISTPPKSPNKEVSKPPMSPIRRSAPASVLSGAVSLLQRRGGHHRHLGSQLEDSDLQLHAAAQDLFDLVARAQSCRLDDQRCTLPRGLNKHKPTREKGAGSTEDVSPSPPPAADPHGAPGPRELLESTLRGPQPWPDVVLPPEGGRYWLEQPLEQPLESLEEQLGEQSIEQDETASVYRTHFLGKDHYTLVYNGSSEAGSLAGPALLSVRQEDGGDTRLLLRLRSGTVHRVVSEQQAQQAQGATQLAKLASSEVSGSERFSPVMSPRASQLVTVYDEHSLASTFKFGVLEQRKGQVSEEQMFNNKDPSPGLLEFLELVGRTVNLKEHKGYRGGLDTQFGQTGEQSVYTELGHREVMLHVAPLLPYIDNDPQQVQRKRHIGNDIVCVIFQEEATPFAPHMIASHFLHVFIVVRPVREPTLRYRVWVTARSDVPKFGPALPPGCELESSNLRDWLLPKLINGEGAACKAAKFASLEARTRCALLTALCEELSLQTRLFLYPEEEQDRPSSRVGESHRVPAGGSPGSPHTPPLAAAGPTIRFISSVRRAIRARSQSVADSVANKETINLPERSASAVVAPTSPLHPTPPSSLPWRKGQLGNKPSLPESPLTSVTAPNSPLESLQPSTPTWRKNALAGPPSPSHSAPSGSTSRLARSASEASSLEAAPANEVLTSDLHHVTSGSLHSAGSDTGLESMDSPTARLACCCGGAESACRNGVDVLRDDKLSLLRSTEVCHDEMRTLREEAVLLQIECAAASQHLQRLRSVITDCCRAAEASSHL